VNSGRTGAGGRSRRRSGLLEALQDAGFVAAPAPPRTWQELLAATVTCDEATPMFGEPLVLDWLRDDTQEAS
jgi:hypothetical protein